MKKKYKSEFLGSLHETAIGLHRIGVINDKEMQEYNQDCLVNMKKTDKKLESSNDIEQINPATVWTNYYELY